MPASRMPFTDSSVVNSCTTAWTRSASSLLRSSSLSSSILAATTSFRTSRYDARTRSSFGSRLSMMSSEMGSSATNTYGESAGMYCSKSLPALMAADGAAASSSLLHATSTTAETASSEIILVFIDLIMNQVPYKCLTKSSSEGAPVSKFQASKVARSDGLIIVYRQGRLPSCTQYTLCARNSTNLHCADGSHYPRSC